MLITLLSAAMASQGWSESARTHIPDRISVEVEMRQLDIPASAASYLGGDTWWETDETGQTVERHTLRWLRLSDDPLAQATTPTEQTSHCVAIEGHDPIPGGRQIHLYRSSATDNDEHAQIALGARPGMLLASTDDGEVAMLSLRPGDQVLLVDAQHNRRGIREEFLSLRRGKRELRMTRRESGSEACYTPVEDTE